MRSIAEHWGTKRILPQVPLGIVVKLTLAFLLVSVLGAALAAVFARQATQSEFDQYLTNRGLSDFVTTAAAYYQSHGSWNGVSSMFPEGPGPNPGGQPGYPESPGGPGGGQAGRPVPFCLTDAAGRVVVGNRDHHPGDTVPASELQHGTPVTVNGQVVGMVLTPNLPPTLDPLAQQYLARTDQALIEAALGAIVLGLLAGVFLARSLTRPVREMTAAVRRIEQGQLEQQVPVRSRDELGELAAAFNSMSASLNRSNQLRRQMTADIAHDLRSPLAVIAGYLESLRDGVLKPTPQRFEVLYTEAQHLQRLIDDLRTLSLADAGELAITRQRISPGELLVRLSAAYQGQAEARDIDLAVEIPPDLPAVDVDPDRMVQVLGNLVRNALAHTPPDGVITLSARPDGRQVVLTVRDTGEGMPSEVVAHVFERFYRGDEARQQDGSSGLGLAIAKALVELHGGRISAQSAGPGRGSEFAVRLPAAA